jgi:hypothetical protein
MDFRTLCHGLLHTYLVQVTEQGWSAISLLGRIKIGSFARDEIILNGRNHNNSLIRMILVEAMSTPEPRALPFYTTITSRIGQVSQHRVEPVSLDSQARLTAANCWGVVTEALFA